MDTVTSTEFAAKMNECFELYAKDARVGGGGIRLGPQEKAEALRWFMRGVVAGMNQAFDDAARILHEIQTEKTP